MSDESTRRKPRNLLIYPKFQIQLILFNSLLFLLTFALSGFYVWSSLGTTQRLGIEAGLNPGHPYFSMIELQREQFLWGQGSAFLVAWIGSTAISFLLSHRLAGPILRLRSFFSEIAESGEFRRPIRFRKNDFFDELPGLINKALEKINTNPKG